MVIGVGILAGCTYALFFPGERVEVTDDTIKRIGPFGHPLAFRLRNVNSVTVGYIPFSGEVIHVQSAGGQIDLSTDDSDAEIRRALGQALVSAHRTSVVHPDARPFLGLD
ncbi:hypothetical protein [Xylanimonas sp. McL0601]|uniref:hypothetical protein n=1 Tax=Xylanimonas sp. McL0601 TaxID=3414739 RepID=UPI003CF9D7C4